MPLPASGVVHIRTRLTERFTVIANALAQRRGSAVTLGVATYILSLPDGAPISIKALSAHFAEGEILIARALNELESLGYLERARERHADGRIRTRTFAYDVPRRRERERPRPAPPPPALVPAAEPEVPPGPPGPTGPTRLTADDPRATAVLAALRWRDPRLALSEREIAHLAPAVTEWLGRGTGPREIADTLTADLPPRINRRPARLLAYRLDAFRPPVPVPKPPTRIPVPLQNCPACDRAFRSPAPGRCRDCRRPRPCH